MNSNGKVKGIMWLGKNGHFAQVDAETMRRWLEAGLLVAYAGTDSPSISPPVPPAMAAQAS